jgi:hypothetical protein
MRSPKRILTAATLATGLLAGTAAAPALAAPGASAPAVLATYTTALAESPHPEPPHPPTPPGGEKGANKDDNGHFKPGDNNWKANGHDNNWNKGRDWDRSHDRDHWNWGGHDWHWWHNWGISPRLCRDGGGHVDWQRHRCEGGRFDDFRVR